MASTTLPLWPKRAAVTLVKGDLRGIVRAKPSAAPFRPAFARNFSWQLVSLPSAARTGDADARKCRYETQFGAHYCELSAIARYQALGENPL